MTKWPNDAWETDIFKIEYAYIQFDGKNEEDIAKFLDMNGVTDDVANRMSVLYADDPTKKQLCIIMEWLYDYRPYVNVGDYVVKPSFGPGYFVWDPEMFEARLIPKNDTK